MLRIVRTTDNFWDAYLLRTFKGTRKIRFRNGVELRTDYSQYAKLRDWFEELRNNQFIIEKTSGGYLIKNVASDTKLSFYTECILTAKPLFDFLLSLSNRGWSILSVDNCYKLEKAGSTYLIEQLAENSFRLKSKNTELIGPKESLMVYFNELFEAELYENIYLNKTVLDIGGFCGETAVFFSKRGAKKVIIYEPVQEHQHTIIKNLELNGVNAELHDEGISEKDGVLTINYEALDLGFGLANKGRYQTCIKTRNVSDVILESHADIAKIDCEGAEISIVNVAPEIIGLINYYIVETHSPEIEKAVTEKFLSSGFRVAREPVNLAKGISMHYFEKILENTTFTLMPYNDALFSKHAEEGFITH